MDEREVVTRLLGEIDDMADSLSPADLLSLAAALTVVLFDQDCPGQETNPSPNKKRRMLN
jgi:hypothetical protein